MPTLLQINTTCNSASHGRIAEGLGKHAVQNGWNSYIAYGTGSAKSRSHSYKIQSKSHLYRNVLLTRMFDCDGFLPKKDTLKLIRYIDAIKPDIIHLHNLHGYYLNLEVLFKYLSQRKITIVWTLHDCWTVTGHCSHFDYIGCEKWKTQCFNCPLKKSYPASILVDASEKHYIDKKELFTLSDNTHIVVPSNWLSKIIEESYLKKYPIHIINNGVDLNVFRPTNDISLLDKYGLKEKEIILGVPSKYSMKRCLNSFLLLSELLNDNQQIVLIGLSKREINRLPRNILGIEHTESISEMVAWYSCAEVFVNTTLEDTFPTTNLEALACGTSVITFATGGSVESVQQNTGFIIPQNDIKALKVAIDKICQKDKSEYQAICVQRANEFYNEDNCYSKYFDLYNQLLLGK